MIKKELNLPANTAFEKAILLLYFSDRRNEIINKISEDTKKAMNHVVMKINELYENT